MKFLSIASIHFVWLKSVRHYDGTSQLYVCKWHASQFFNLHEFLFPNGEKNQEESVSSIAPQLKITVTEVCWSGDDKAIGLGRLGTLGHNPRRNICDSRPDWGSARVQHKTRKLGGKTHVPYPNWMCSCYGRVKTVQMFKTSIDNKIDIKMIWINCILTCSASYGMIHLIFWEIEIVYYRDHKGTPPNCLAKVQALFSTSFLFHHHSRWY